MEGNTKGGASSAITGEQGSSTPPGRGPTQEHLGTGRGLVDHTRTTEETDMGPQGDIGPDPETVSLSMASTIDDLLACKRFAEAIKE